MIKILVLVIALLSIYASHAMAQTWRPVFVTLDGTRIDFIAHKRSFASQVDKASAYRFEFNVPSEGTHASIRLLPVGENRGPSEDYDATIVMRGSEMIVLVMHNAGLQRGDKFEVYTLYPKLDIGFLVETSSFLGSPLMKELAPVRQEVPSASAKAFPLRRIDR